MTPQVVFYGAVVSPESLTSYKALPKCLLAVGSSGTINWMLEDVPEYDLQTALAQKESTGAELVVLRQDEFLLPGFIDTHTHAPQFPNIGSGQQYELLDWLDNVTFPMEARFKDAEFARRIYTSVVRQVIDSGTTTCCYYGTLHLEATMILAEIVHANGQRAFIGKCNMDRNSPSYYVDPSPESSVSDAKALVAYIRSLPLKLDGTSASPLLSPLVQPILTPRFAISCSPALLSALGEVASQDVSLRIQTHISENKDEIVFTRKLFPHAKNYADVYDSFGLLRHNTILAHAVHLEDPEIQIIKERRAGISHCPTSNFNLTSGIAPIGRYLDAGIKVGLGTDVSGGFSPSILNAIQNASVASKILEIGAGSIMQEKARFVNRKLSVATLLYLATLGGAEVCDIDGIVGSFVPGKSFDALVVGARSEDGGPAFQVFDSFGTKTRQEKETLDGQLERFLFCGDDRNILRVYVQGRVIGGKTYHT